MWGCLRTGVLSLVLGVSLGRLLGRLLRRRPEPTEDPVTASGRLIAAWRALESLEPAGARLFLDPFAAFLAGSAAVREALHLALPWPEEPGSSSTGGANHSSANSNSQSYVQAATAGAATTSEASAAGAGDVFPAPSPLMAQRRFRFSNVAVRVAWFDRQLLHALTAPAAGQLSQQQQPRQVVVLGAGMDARPWRLPLPPGVRWFEVDFPEVVAAKAQLLEQLGAALQAAPAAPAAHTLCAATWAALPLDLGRPGWVTALQAAGLDTSKTTVWVLEGLLMYLTGQEVTALLCEVAAASPRGSLLIAHHTTSELFELIQGGESSRAAAAYAPFPPELVATWRSGFPLASQRDELAAMLAAAGWGLGEATSRARIAAQVCCIQREAVAAAAAGAAAQAAAEAAEGRGGAEGSVGGSSASSGQAGGQGGIQGGSLAGHSTPLAASLGVEQRAAAVQATARVPAGLSVEQVAARCDFEVRPDEGRDRWAVFFTATKQSRQLAA